jgi:uncharacterized protein (DUF1015 family)
MTLLEAITGYVVADERGVEPAHLAEVLPPSGRVTAAGLARSRDRLRRLLDEGRYVPLDGPCLLVTEIDDGAHRATSIVGDLPAVAFEDGTVLPHEHVDPDRLATLRRHLEVVGAVSTPVSLAHPDAPGLSALVDEVTGQPPRVRVAGERATVTVWVVRSPSACTRLATAVAATDGWLVADGHHRAATGRATGHVLVALTPDDALTARPFHRRVELRRPDRAVEVLRAAGLRVTPLPTPALPERPGEVTLAVEDGWWRVPLRTVGGGARDRLDVVRAEAQVLEPLAAALGTGAPPRPVAPDDEVRGLPAEGTATVLLHPPTLPRIREVAAAGEVLPPKSTYVVPKQQPGVLVVPRTVAVPSGRDGGR